MSDAANLIASFEGFSSTAYYDYGQWTVGYGSKATGPNQVVTREQGVEMLNSQISGYAANVDKYNSTYNWTPNERAALTSFAYNIGSIDQLTANGTRSREEIAQSMLLYDKAGGQRLDGLSERRAAEQALFLGNRTVDELVETRDSGQVIIPSQTAGARNQIRAEEEFRDFDNSISWDRLENGSHMKDNNLDEFDNYIYNIELFLVDRETTISFLKNNNISNDTANGKWPGQNQKVMVASTGKTSEIMITDLNVESVSYGNKTSTITNNALNLNFTLSRIGHGHIAEVLQDAALIAGYPNISIANFFIKIDFKGFKEGRYWDIPGSTKVIPFRLSKLTDISTTTDQRGTNAVIEGVVIRKISVISPDISKLEHALSFTIDQESASETLKTFISELNNKIIEKHPTTRTEFMKTYNIEFSQEFTSRYTDLSIGLDALSSIGTSGGQRRNDPDNVTNTTGSAKETLDLNAGSSIVDIIKDILINAESIKTALTTSEQTFTDVFSIETDYIPKPNGYNIMNNSEGADITYTIGLKELLIDQNSANQIEKLLSVQQIINRMIERSRLCKKYYYYYTGSNDQILDLTISLNQQLTKTYNDSTSHYFDITEIEAVSDYVETQLQLEDSKLRDLRDESNRITTEIEQAQREVEAKTGALQQRATGELLRTARDVLTQVNRQNMIEAGEGSLSQYASAYQLDGFDENTSANEIFNSLDAALGEDGILNDLEETHPLRLLFTEFNEQRKSLQTQVERLRKLRTDGAEATSNLNFGIDTIFGEIFSTDPEFLDLFNTSNNIEKLGLSDDFAIEDINTDVRSALISDDMRPLLDLTISNGVRFRKLAEELMNTPKELMVATNRSRENIELARKKFIEAYEQDISMQNATMTIKGDPFWLENYKVKPRELTGGSNLTPNTNNNDSTSIGGPHSLMIITNTADGTDANHNTQLTRLFRYIYIVKKITSSFSGGLFTQTLDMNKFHLASIIDTFNPRIGGTGTSVTGIGGTSEDGSGFLEEGTSGNGNGGGNDPDIRIGEPNVVNDNVSGGGTYSGRGLVSPSIVAENGWERQRGSFTTLVDSIIDSPIPNGSQSARFANIYREAVAAATNGSATAQSDLDTAIATMKDHFGPTSQEAADIIQGLADDGEEISPEFLAMMDTVFGESVSDLVTLPQPVDVSEILTEIETMTAPAFMPASDLTSDAMVLTPDPVLSLTPPSTLSVVNSNQIIENELVVAAAKDYALPPSVLEAYDKYGSTRSTDYANAVALVTTSEAIMLAKIEQEQISLLEETDGSFAMLSPEQQNYYDSLTAQSVEIQNAAKGDPARFIVQQQMMEDDLNTMIEEYNLLAQTTYDPSRDAMDARLEQMAILESNIHTLDAQLPEILPTATIPRIQDNELISMDSVGSDLVVNVDTNPYLPQTYSVYSSTNSNFEITEDMKNQYEQAREILNNFRADYEGNTLGEVTVTWEYNGVVETYTQDVITQFANPSLAAQYGYVAGVAGSTYDIDDPVISQYNLSNYDSVGMQVADQFPDLTYGIPSDIRDAFGSSVVNGPLSIEIEVGTIVILDPEEP
jgi:GH24 family phage-related lysozyme (muramidase)